MGAPPFPPQLPVTGMRTYRITAPLATHWRPATCAEADCPSYLDGWRTTVDESTELGQRQAHYIRHDRSRRHTELRTLGGLTAFEFEPGQKCFSAAEHRATLGRPDVYAVRDGDWRGNPTGWVRRHASYRDWLDDFGEHQEHLAHRLQQG